MIAYERLVFAGPSILILGAFSLILGLNVAKRKPVLIWPKSQRWSIFLMFLPMLTMVVYRLGTDSLNPEFQMMSLIASLLTLSVLVSLCAVLMFLSTRSIWVFNVTETMLLEALSEALQRHRIKYSLNQRRHPAGKINRPSWTIMSLTEQRGLIKITSSTLGRAWIRFSGKKHIQNYDALMSDFWCILKAKDYDGATTALPFFLASTISISIVIYGALVILLK